jgi:hypothetical protein
MHIFEIETEDLKATQDALAAGRPQRTPTPAALDPNTALASWYKLRN